MRGERGSGTVLVLGVMALLLLVGFAASALGGVGVARHQAASAADLAALAAAGRAAEGGAAACTAAGRVAAAAGAELAQCSLDGVVAEVVAVVRPAGWLGGLGRASARARAGPVTGGNAVPPRFVPSGAA